MKKSSKTLLGLLVLAVAATVIYRAVNQAPADNLSAEAKMSQILTDGGCLSCHSAKPKLPFYANWPLVNKIVHEDVDSGYRIFDMEPMMKALAEGKPINQVDLAKVEQCIADGSMPLAKYYLVHWGSSITDTKKEMVMAATKELRAKYYPNPLAAPEFANEPVRPLPDSVSVDPRKVELGKLLYFDTRLSSDGTISCASCHDLNMGGSDNQMVSDGVGGQEGGVNSPTVYNSFFNFVQFWDGRANTLAEQASGPPVNPVEMGNKSFDEIIVRLKKDAAFTKQFLAVYPEMSEATVTDAIQEYEKTLLTPNSAFDRYLKGDKNALAANDVKGYELFKQYRCATCHAGEILGGQTFELMGERANYFVAREKKNFGVQTDADNGRYAQTKVERDRYRFKTPGLRNVALTAPYYHDGKVNTLDEAVAMMAEYQVGVKLTKEEIAHIVAFLNTLTGEYQGKKLTAAK